MTEPTQDNNKQKSREEQWEELARKQVQAEFDLLAAYINLSKKARTWGSVIKNSDFEKIQDDFNNRINAIKDEQQHFFDNPETSLLKEKELYRKLKHFEQ